MHQVPLLGRSLAVPMALKCAKQPLCVPIVPKFFSTSQSTLEQQTEARRRLHSFSNKSLQETTALDAHSVTTIQSELTREPNTMAKKIAPLSVLPLSMVIRTLATTTISSSRILLPPSLAVMKVLAHTENAVLNPDKNSILGWFLKKTFYAQFCAGENAAEVRSTVDGLKKIGFTGVILCYAMEVVLSKSQTQNLTACDKGAEKDECVRNEIVPWVNGTMETVRLSQPGDFVALKFTGAGRQALYALKNRLPPPKELRAGIDDVCNLARARNIPLLFDAEQTAFQPGIDDWTLDYQRKYNTDPAHALIYGTYQAYLKACPEVLGSHLEAASKEGFTLGVKLVRGAYLGTDPRHIIHDTQEDTDKCYDGISESLIRREWTGTLTKDVKYPLVSLMIASHNLQSVRQARAIRDSITVPAPKTFPAHGPVREFAIAQLQGMADDVSCELVSANKNAEKKADDETTGAYKYLPWGTIGECMKYLYRRANENRDSVGRTKTARDAMWGEVKRRCWASLGRE